MEGSPASQTAKRTRKVVALLRCGTYPLAEFILPGGGLWCVLRWLPVRVDGQCKGCTPKRTLLLL